MGKTADGTCYVAEKKQKFVLGYVVLTLRCLIRLSNRNI